MARKSSEAEPLLAAERMTGEVAVSVAEAKGGRQSDEHDQDGYSPEELAAKLKKIMKVIAKQVLEAVER